jgi:hypothetical protein
MKAAAIACAAALACMAGCSSASGSGGFGPNDPPGADAGPSGPVAGNDSGQQQDTGVGGPVDGGRVSPACATAAASLCNKENTCWPDLVLQLYGSVKTCTARKALECKDQLSAPGSGWDAMVETACIDAIAVGSCGDYFDGVLPDACRPSTGGSVATGAACGTTSQCASDSSCFKSGSSFCGTCTPEVTTPGGACTAADCGSGLTCAGGVCTAWVPVGGACSANARCAFPNFCVNGACSAPLQAGATCTRSPDTCDVTAGLYCRASTLKCESYAYAGYGQSCGILSTGRVLCRAGGFCQGLSATVTAGKCVAPAADGAACDDTKGPSCLPPAYCAAGKCTLPDSSTCQ